jgi:hypothetical protein
LIDVVCDGLARGIFDFGGRCKIRETLRQVDSLVFERKASHFSNDGLGELLGFGGQHAPRQFAGCIGGRRVTLSFFRPN